MNKKKTTTPVVVSKPTTTSSQDKEWDAIQDALSSKLSHMGVDNLSPAEINYITQKIHNHRRSHRLTMQLQAVSGVSPTKQNPAAATRNVPATQNRTPEPAKKAYEPAQQTQLRKVTTEISLGSRQPVNQAQRNNQPNNPPTSPKVTVDSPKLTSNSTGNKQSGPIDYEKEYYFFKERCAKLEQVAKWLRELQSKNQKLEAELLQYQKGANVSSNTERINELEKRYASELQKKTNIIQALRSKMEEVKLENEVLREQIADQNKLIERLEDGFKMAMDQVDYLTSQIPGPSQPTQQKQQQPTSELYDDDINYDDLDEATLMQLLTQTREALMEKRKSFNSLSDSYDDSYDY